MQHEALAHSGGKQLRMLAKDLRQMAEVLWIGHARCVVLCTIERFARYSFLEMVPWLWLPYGAVCSIHSIGLEVGSSYCLHRFSTSHEIRWNREHLIQQRFELPAFSTLDRLVGHLPTGCIRRCMPRSRAR